MAESAAAKERGDAPVEHGAKISPRLACVKGSDCFTEVEQRLCAVFLQMQEDGVFHETNQKGVHL